METIPIHARTVNKVAENTVKSWREMMLPITTAAESAATWIATCLDHMGDYVSVALGEKLVYEGHALCVSVYADVTIVDDCVHEPVIRESVA